MGRVNRQAGTESCRAMGSLAYVVTIKASSGTILRQDLIAFLVSSTHGPCRLLATLQLSGRRLSIRLGLKSLR